MGLLLTSKWFTEMRSGSGTLSVRHSHLLAGRTCSRCQNTSWGDAPVASGRDCAAASGTPGFMQRLGSLVRFCRCSDSAAAKSSPMAATREVYLLAHAASTNGAARQSTLSCEGLKAGRTTPPPCVASLKGMFYPRDGPRGKKSWRPGRKHRLICPV